MRTLIVMLLLSATLHAQHTFSQYYHRKSDGKWIRVIGTREQFIRHKEIARSKKYIEIYTGAGFHLYYPNAKVSVIRRLK